MGGGIPQTVRGAQTASRRRSQTRRAASGGDRGPPRTKLARIDRHAGAEALCGDDPRRADAPDPERAVPRLSRQDLDAREAMGRYARGPDRVAGSAAATAVRGI